MIEETEDCTFTFRNRKGVKGLKDKMESGMKNKPHIWGKSLLDDWDRMKQLLVHVIDDQVRERKRNCEEQKTRD